mgnify:CR=1 FL=1
MEKITPFFETKNGVIYQGESLRILTGMEGDSVDAIVTDPPYSSGGFTRSDRGRKAEKKYQNTGTARSYPDFIGDNRDGRSWLAWSSLWLAECFRVAKDGAVILMFTDWRQLPTASDALQAGGFVWRGVVAWDKTLASRPSLPGFFRHQCEYILWGTKGEARAASGALAGCFSIRVNPQEKYHLTGKPVELMTALLQATPEGGVVLDPFMGSGTTCVAAAMTNRRFIGIEYSTEYCHIAAQRLAGLLPLEVA